MYRKFSKNLFSSVIIATGFTHSLRLGSNLYRKAHPASKLINICFSFHYCKQNVTSSKTDTDTDTIMATTSEVQKHPLLTFGVIADVQYADCENGMDFAKIRTRYYRNSLNLLKNAVNDWKRCQDPISFVLQLGDLIDGKCKAGGPSGSQKALNTALQPFNSLHVPVYHLIGNHELYNFNRSFCLKCPLNSALTTEIQCEPDRLYYTFLPHPKLRIILLDAYEVGVLGYSDDSENENYVKGKALLREHNSNPGENDTTGLEGVNKRWAAYNGGIGNKQLQWLSQTLDRAQSKQENVIISSHIGFYPNVPENYSVSLSWTYQEVLDVVHRYDCVVGIFAGHEHAGYQHFDGDHKIQHIAFQGVIETAPGTDAYATARLWNQELTISGMGRVPSCSIALRYPV